MALNLVQTLRASKAAATLFNTYTTAKTVINAEDLVKIPMGFWEVGKALRIVVHAGISNRVTGPDTTTFQVMLGALGTVVAFTSGAINLTTTAHTTLPAILEFWLTCRATGPGATSANLMGQCRVGGQMFCSTSGTDSAVTHGHILAPNTAPAVGTSFDNTVDNLLDFYTAQSVSNAGNGIQVQQYLVEAYNYT